MAARGDTRRAHASNPEAPKSSAQRLLLRDAARSAGDSASHAQSAGRDPGSSPGPALLHPGPHLAALRGRGCPAAGSRLLRDESTPRKSRLLLGSGRSAYARYGYEDGSEVALIYQAWPSQSVRSLQERSWGPPSLQAGNVAPDLFIVRTGPEPDCAILELKATYSPGYLGSGLSQLLGYLGERPEIWKNKPSGWLVAPGSPTFTNEVPADDEDLWLVSAEAVSDQAVARFAAEFEINF